MQRKRLTRRVFCSGRLKETSSTVPTISVQPFQRPVRTRARTDAQSKSKSLKNTESPGKLDCFVLRNLASQGTKLRGFQRLFWFFCRTNSRLM